MKLTKVLTICAMLAIPGALAVYGRAQAQAQAAPARPGLTLTSSAYEDTAVIPAKYTQSVPDPISPKLQWTNVPPNTVSFTLIMHDPEGVVDKTSEDVLHWLAFNIPGTARDLPEAVPATAQLPDGTVQGKNRRGAIGFLGPGAGAAGPYHHYTIELYALDAKLNLGPDATRADVLNAMNGHIMAKAVLVGRFHR